MKFQDVIGQEQITGHLQNAIRMEKISHAYIIQGEAGSGKKMLANLFATTLQCEEGASNPVGTVSPANRRYPEIIRISGE